MVGPGLASGLLAAAAIGTASEHAMLIEADLEPAQVLVQAQSVYRLRLYQAIDVRDIVFGGPEPRVADVRVIGPDRVYETLRDGRRYRVHERSYAIRPFTSGALQLSGYVTGRVPSSTAPDGRHALRLEAPPRTLDVLPVPSASGGAPWLPAHKLGVSEVWTPTLQVGQAQRRTIRIEAEGVDAGQLPELPVTVPGMAVHAEPARLENHHAGARTIGMREQTFNLVALRSGTIVVPDLKISWWNVDTNLPAVATLPARILTVAPAQGTMPGPVLAIPPASAMAPTKSGPSLWLPGASALLLCLTGWLWYRRRASVGAAWRLRGSCRRADLHGVRDGLLAWTASVRPQLNALTLGALGGQLDDPAARRALDELERGLYGQEPRAFDVATLWAAVRTVKRAVRCQR